MKIKTISKVITEKVSEWISSITDDGLKKDLPSKVIVTGGCITSLLSGEKVNDFDVYFTDFNITKRVAEYYMAIANEEYHCGARLDNTGMGLLDNRVRIFIPSVGVAGKEQPEEIEGRDAEDGDSDVKPYFPIHLSENAITLSSKIQLVVRFYGNPDEIHKNYDFVHCTNYWTKGSGLVCNKDALESILTKELRYVGSLYPLCSIIRTRKFIGRGWRIHAGQYLKMCFQLNEMDLKNIDVLREQLTGVDSSYFHTLITALEKKKESDPGFVVSSPYVAELVDRIFG